MGVAYSEKGRCRTIDLQVYARLYDAGRKRGSISPAADLEQQVGIFRALSAKLRPFSRSR